MGGVARETWLLASALLALSSGIAQLAVSGIGRVVFAILCGGTLLFIAIRILQVMGLGKLRGLEQEARLYQATLSDIVERNVVNFEERVEITYHIGTGWSDDVVTEKRWTDSTGTLLYRAFRLTVNGDLTEPLQLDAIKLSAWCDSSPETRVQVIPLDSKSGGARVMALFQPAATQQTCWTVHYRPQRGLWDPLRQDGRDTLGYHAPVYSDERGRMASLSIRFVFPPGISKISIREHKDRGVQTESHEGGATIITWSISPAPSAYFRWTLSAKF
jgi:TM2 domain-containing membrane protein YozV